MQMDSRMGTKGGAIEAKLIVLRYKVQKQQEIKMSWLTYKDITCDNLRRIGADSTVKKAYLW